jgi:F0F1-type ATP synthase assembly protein I
MAVDHPGAALPTEPKAPEKSLGELFSELTSDLSNLFRKEVELAKVETKEEVARAGKAGGMLGGGALAGWFALLFLSFALAWLLDEWMHTALAFLIVGLIYGVVAAVLALQGKARLQSVNPVPQQTVETLKEDVQWARAQRS